MKTYKHLNQEERDLIAVHLAEGRSLRLIARGLERSPEHDIFCRIERLSIDDAQNCKTLSFG